MSASNSDIKVPVTIEQLEQLVEQPETHRAILGHYQGPYSLGVTLVKSDHQQPALLLRVTTSEPSEFPDAVTLSGLRVPLIVQGGFRTPQPLGSGKRTD